jgi:transposase
MVVLMTPGQQHEATMFEPLMEQGKVKRRGRGRPRIRPRRVVGDKGYSSRANRTYARRRGMRVTIPRRSNEHRHGPFDKAAYRQRNRVERLIGLMKQKRRLATRYEKRVANYRAMWVIAATIHWLQFADTP